VKAALHDSVHRMGDAPDALLERITPAAAGRMWFTSARAWTGDSKFFGQQT
jgi:hypothetical protein